MHNPRRRCRSEQVASRDKRVIPPHKAAGLRRAQLREIQDCHLPISGFSRNFHIEPDYSNEKEVVVQKRQSSAPVSLPQEINHTKVLSHHPITLSQQTRSQTEDARQEKINNHLPSIDAVLSKAEDRDKRRKLGESEFYEHIDDSGIVRRQSMIRAVDKDDFLVARGANPRTGLITPDWNSVASSVNNDIPRQNRRCRPSAQWKLDGDSWISVPPEEQMETVAAGVHAKLAVIDSCMGDDNPAYSTFSPHPVTALTERNLRSFSDQTQHIASLQQDSSPASTPAKESQVKRKPIGSPKSLLVPNRPLVKPRREVSGDTVIHSPGAFHEPRQEQQKKTLQYYSPDSVGRDLLGSDATNFAQRVSNEIPFLGVAVGPRSTINPLPKGFTSKSVYLDQLQHSLRTSNGPYPSRPSNQRGLPQSRSQPLHSLHVLSGSHSHPTRSTKDSRAPRPPVQRVYHPDVMDSLKSAEHRVHPQNCSKIRAHGGQAYLDYQRKPRIMYEGGPHHSDMSRQISAQQLPDIMYTATDTCIPTPGRLVAKVIPGAQHPVQGSLLYSTNLGRDHLKHDDIQEPSGLAKERVTTIHHRVIDPSKDATSSRRPPLGSRAHEMLQVPGVRMEATGTGPEARLNMTGTKTTQESEIQKHKDLIHNPQDCTSSSGSLSGITSPTLSDQEVLSTIQEARDGDSTRGDSPAFIDHNVCCPECCTTSDCHEGCLGHSTPDVSVVGSETSSLASMGIFDASFATSVKAVNKALLTPMDKSDGKLAKLRSALGLKPATSPTPRGPARPNTMRRSLREESLSQKIDASSKQQFEQATDDQRWPNSSQARTAATKALCTSGSPPNVADNANKAPGEPEGKAAQKPKSKKDKKEKAQPVTEANEGRRVISSARKASKGNESKCEDQDMKPLVNVSARAKINDKLTIEDTACNILTHNSSEMTSVFDRVSTFIRRRSTIIKPKYISMATLTSPVVLHHLHSLAMITKDMSVTIAETTSVVIAMAFEYNRSGKVVLPAGTNASELGANLLRSILYLMVTACMYALFLRTGRVVLAVLRVVLLPVRICVWILG